MNKAKEWEQLIEIDRYFTLLNGEPLAVPQGIRNRLEWLHQHAPFGILAHNAKADPHFIYANQTALDCFKYSNEEILRLPSRLSAAPDDRAERQRLLDEVQRQGIAYDYRGTRIDKMNNPFTIYDGIIWQLGDPATEQGVWGQAACFFYQPI